MIHFPQYQVLALSDIRHQTMPSVYVTAKLTLI